MTSSIRKNSLPHEIVEGTANRIRATREIIEGDKASISPIVKMIVLDVIFDPTIVDENMRTYLLSLGILNDDIVDSLPRNTVIAKQVADGSPGSERPPMFVYPFFAHLSLPIKPGEHVWVLLYPDLEKKQATVAYWMSRVVEPHAVDDVNHTHSPRVWDSSYVKGTRDEWNANTDITYDYSNGRVVSNADGERIVDPNTAPLIDSPFSSKTSSAYVDVATKTNSGKMSPIEPVPRFRKRPGDFAIEGSNNTLIVLGLDRQGPVAEYDVDPETGAKVAKMPSTDIAPSAGAIDIVAGRGQTPRTLGKTATNQDVDADEIAKSLKNDDPDMQFEGDPDFVHDRARVYVAQRTRVDAKLGLTSLNLEFGDTVSDDAAGSGAAIVKADKVRVIARQDIEFVMVGFERDDKGNVIETNDTSKMAAIVFKANGEVVIRAAALGVIKLGGDDADKALLCSDVPAVVDQLTGDVQASPLVSTGGGRLGEGGLHGTFAKKVLVRG